MAKRKIVQLAATYAPRDRDGGVVPQERLFALCNDGSVWEYRHWSGRVDPDWMRLADVPQD
jgi:hypothetical protein